MTNFWTISIFWALFLLFIGIALAWVLPPLLRRDTRTAPRMDVKEANVAIYRDQLAELKADFDSGDLDAQQYELARLEITRRLSEDVPQESAPVVVTQSRRWLAYTIGGAIPALAVALYVWLGNPEALVVDPTSPAQDAATAGPEGQHDVAPMIAALEARLEQNPGDAEGWYMLARSYSAVGRFEESAQAYAKVVEQFPNEPRLLADYADVLAMAQGRTLKGKPQELINRALALNPSEEKALHLAGSAAYESGNFAQAVLHWQRLLKLLPPDTDNARAIAEAISDAGKAAAAAGQVVQPVPDVEKSAQAAPGAAISGTVSLGKALASKVAATDTVFIFAQSPQGPKMPLAGIKITASQLPYRFVLDDSSAMTPNNKLSDHPQVMVSARVSKSGQAMAQSGDFQGQAGPVKLGQQGLNIEIDTVLP
jgi:cytochrome c-type biogenesis protein CcmH